MGPVRSHPEELGESEKLGASGAALLLRYPPSTPLSLSLYVLWCGLFLHLSVFAAGGDESRPTRLARIRVDPHPECTQHAQTRATPKREVLE